MQTNIDAINEQVNGQMVLAYKLCETLLEEALRTGCGITQSLKIVKNRLSVLEDCQMCDAMQNEHVSEFCPRHSVI